MLVSGKSGCRLRINSEDIGRRRGRRWIRRGLSNVVCVCTFSFGLSRKKKIPKRKGPRLRLRCYSGTAIRRRGSNSLRSDRSPLTCAGQCLRLRTYAYAGELRGRGAALKFLIFFEEFLAKLFYSKRGKEFYKIFFGITQVQGTHSPIGHICRFADKRYAFCF